MDLDLDDRGVIRAKRRLQAFFDRDDLKRFKMERQVGEGAFGTAWKVSYRPYTEEEVRSRARDQLPNPIPEPEVPEVQHIILKTSKVAALYYKDSAIKTWPEDDEEEGQEDAPLDPFYANNSIVNERRWLRKFRFSKHIVKLIEPALNPLNRKTLGLRRRLARNDYIFMEYLENGTIGDFITGINIMGGVSFVPNRFLWRCFLCLIRGCIAMAWPPTEEDASGGTSVIERAKAGDPSRIVHDDMHHFNLMFGPLVNDPNEPEHHPRIPSIKIIDFGSVFEKENQGNHLSQPTAVTDNIYSIARVRAPFSPFSPSPPQLIPPPLTLPHPTTRRSCARSSSSTTSRRS
ncbi:hypothetical protein F4809DRAFT_658030 [Biscogniauxia mediterranea]|nr:hypothetical protein F4809DRAFT_658030 [Biscogniauxia mediterranea]